MRAVAALIVFLMFGLNAASADVNVSVTVNPKSGTVADRFSLAVQLAGEHAAAVQPPVFEDNGQFSISSRGTSSRHTIINGQASREVTFTFVLVPSPDLTPGEYVLPRASLAVGGKNVALRMPSVTIERESSAAREKVQGVDFVQLVDNLEPYVGEQILYRSEVVTSAQVSRAALDNVELKGFWRESFGKEREVVRTIANSAVKVYSLREALFAAQSGEIQIPARGLEADIRVYSQPQRAHGWGGLFDDFWAGVLDDDFQTTRKRVVAEPVSVRVKPLPSAPVPNLSYVPVGKIEMDMTVDKSQLKVGESLNVTVVLSGDANLRPLDLQFPQDGAGALRSYADAPTVETYTAGNRVYFRKRFGFAVVPQQPGALELPAIRVVTFEPKSGQYKILEGPKRLLRVTADPTAKLAVTVAPPQVPEPQPIDRRPEVLQLGEDLLPQHVGESALRMTHSFSDSFVLCIVIGAPLLALLLTYGRIRAERLRSNPEISLQKNAYSKAAGALGRGPTSAEELARVFRVYVGERFRRRGESLTAQEAYRFLLPQVGEELAARARDSLGRLERLTYSGHEAAPEDVQRELAEVIQGIEKTAGAR